ncbi:MAG: hypothetical protein GY841_04495 [FCB group bacterium]|nr:hypothetical protein [FCB group bacterium]
MTIATTTESLCLVTDIKIRMGYESTDTSDDEMLAQIIRGVSSMFDTYADRTFIMNQADATEYYSGGMELYVKRWPVVSITTLKISSDWDWTNVDALVADTDYRLQAADGRIYYLPGISWPSDPYRMTGEFPGGFDNIQIVYTGGYIGPGGSVLSGQTGLPDDIREAAIQQVCFYLKRRHDIGLTAVSAEGQNITKFAPYDLLPSVKKTLARYRR